MSDSQFYCEHCDAMQSTTIEPRGEVFTIRGVNIHVNSATRVCSVCHQPVFDMELDDQKLIQAYALYRNLAGLLHPDEILAIRKKYSLSQSAAAKLLGWSPATFTRYETGSLQEPAHDALLRRFRDDPNWVREMLAKNGDKLSDLQKRKVIKALDSAESSVKQPSRDLSDALNDIYSELLQTGELRALDVVKRHAEQAGVILRSEH